MLNNQRDLVCPSIFKDLRTDAALDAQVVACHYLYIFNPRLIARKFDEVCPHHYALSRVQMYVKD